MSEFVKVFVIVTVDVLRLLDTI